MAERDCKVKMTEYYSLKVELLKMELEERKQRQNQGFVPVFIHAQDSTVLSYSFCYHLLLQIAVLHILNIDKSNVF